MKRISLRTLARRHLLPAMLFLTMLPLLLLPVCQYAPDMLPIASALFAAAAVLFALCTALPGRLRIVCAALFAAMLCAAGAVCLPLSSKPALIALPVFCAAVMLLALPLAGRAISDTPPVFYFIGIFTHMFGYAIIRLSDGSLRLQLDMLQPVLTAAFAAYLLLLLLALNRISLENATMARSALPASMRKANTLLTLCFLALAFCIAAIPLAVRLLLACRDMLFAALRAAYLLIDKLIPDAPTVGGAGGPMMMPFGITAEAYEDPSAFAVLIERIMIALTYLVLILGTLLLIRLIARLALRAIRIAAARLARYSAAISGDYTDEITDTRDEDGRSETYALRIKKRFSPSAMPEEPGARIRWRYARLLARRSWAESSTARENLPPDAAAIYERARYSDLPVRHEDAAQFDAQVRRL